jgi:hypothetical protein
MWTGSGGRHARVQEQEVAPAISPTEASDGGEAGGPDDVQQDAGVNAPADTERVIESELVTLETYTTDLATLDP